MLSSLLTFSPPILSLENLICLSPLALRGDTGSMCGLGGAEGTVRRQLGAHQRWPPQMRGQGAFVALRVTVAPEKSSCLAPSPATMVQEEGRGQRLEPDVLHTDVSHRPISGRHCKQGCHKYIPTPPPPHPDPASPVLHRGLPEPVSWGQEITHQGPI